MDGTEDTLIYGTVLYEHQWRGQYLSGISLDLVNRQFYVSSYYGNSQLRSVLRMPMDVTSGATACLFGHYSIPYARGDNIICPYVGGSKFVESDYEVIVPVYGNVRVATGGSPVVVVPGSAQRQLTFDALQLFDAGIDGRLKDNVSPSPNIGSYSNEDDIVACAQRCLDADTESVVCESFSYSTSRQCYIHSARIGYGYTDYCADPG